MFNLKKILCYLNTFTNLTDLKMFFVALFDFGAIYIAHDYKEVSEKFNKKTKRIESTLVCQRCGDTNIDWKQL
jgi:hypothetical protein